MSRADQIGDALPGDPIIPDVVAPIVAYRLWEWNPTIDRMFSPRGMTTWEPGVPLKATCCPLNTIVIGGGSLPAKQCASSPSDPWKVKRETQLKGMSSAVEQRPITQADLQRVISDTMPDPIHGHYGCGIYGYTTPENLWYDRHGAHTLTLIGEVQLWGKVWEHEKGYRAEYALPVAFYSLPWDNEARVEFLQQAAKVYGCAIKPMPLDSVTMGQIEAQASVDYQNSIYHAIYGAGQRGYKSASVTSATTAAMQGSVLLVVGVDEYQPKPKPIWRRPATCISGTALGMGAAFTAAALMEGRYLEAAANLAATAMAVLLFRNAHRKGA